jgi:hypothetical protein
MNTREEQLEELAILRRKVEQLTAERFGNIGGVNTKLLARVIERAARLEDELARLVAAGGKAGPEWIA